MESRATPSRQLGEPCAGTLRFGFSSSRPGKRARFCLPAARSCSKRPQLGSRRTLISTLSWKFLKAAPAGGDPADLQSTPPTTGE